MLLFHKVAVSCCCKVAQSVSQDVKKHAGVSIPSVLIHVELYDMVFIWFNIQAVVKKAKEICESPEENEEWDQIFQADYHDFDK